MTHKRWRTVASVMAALTSLYAMSACSSAQSRDAPEGDDAPERVSSQTVPAGMLMGFVVSEQVSTGTHKRGDAFSATLRGSLPYAEGNGAIPEGTPARWVVRESTTDGGEALLAVELESIQVNDTWIPVVGEVVRTDIETDHPDTDTETGAKIAVGAAAGALIGQIVGSDTRSTLVGAGMGAAVGTAVALSSRDGSAVLPAGSTITVELTEPLTISGT